MATNNLSGSKLPRAHKGRAGRVAPLQAGVANFAGQRAELAFTQGVRGRLSQVKSSPMANIPIQVTDELLAQAGLPRRRGTVK